MFAIGELRRAALSEVQAREVSTKRRSFGHDSLTVVDRALLLATRRGSSRSGRRTVTAGERSTSKSSVSRGFVERTREALWQLMSRQLADPRLAVVMLDGIEIKGRMNVVALGVTTDGDKLAMGLWAGTTENSTVAGALTWSRAGWTSSRGVLFAIGGSKALRKAIRQVFGDEVPVHRCVRHKERNVIEHLHEADRDPVKRRLRKAWKETDHDRALEQLHRLAVELEREHPGAAASLREGMAETLTVTRLGITGKLKLTHQSTNPCESMISIVRVIQRNVKNWSSGEMCMRWTAAGMLEAETHFRTDRRCRVLASGVSDLATSRTSPPRLAGPAWALPPVRPAVAVSHPTLSPRRPRPRCTLNQIKTQTDR
jgi:transposase-like protein